MRSRLNFAQTCKKMNTILGLTKEEYSIILNSIHKKINTNYIFKQDQPKYAYNIINFCYLCKCELTDNFKKFYLKVDKNLKTYDIFTGSFCVGEQIVYLCSDCNNLQYSGYMCIMCMEDLEIISTNDKNSVGFNTIVSCENCTFSATFRYDQYGKSYISNIIY